MEVMVLMDFEGGEADELTVQVGDLVKNVSKAAEDGWLQGELRGVRGIFPANFVKEIPAYLRGGEHREPRSIRKPKTVKGAPTRRCEVLFPYSPMSEDELELTVGEIVEILKEIEDGWWLGKSNYKLGVFPSNFVKEIFVTGKDYKPAEGKSRPKLTDAIFTKEVKEQQRTSVRRKINSVNECCQVMFDYKSVLDDELDLKKGDIVTIISKVTGSVLGAVAMASSGADTICAGSERSVSWAWPPLSKGAWECIPWPVLQVWVERRAVRVCKPSPDRHDALCAVTSPEKSNNEGQWEETRRFLSVLFR